MLLLLLLAVLLVWLLLRVFLVNVVYVVGTLAMLSVICDKLQSNLSGWEISEQMFLFTVIEVRMDTSTAGSR